MTAKRVPISGLSRDQVESLEDQVESSNATSRSEYLRQAIESLDDSRLRAIDDDPLVALNTLLSEVAPPTDAVEYDPDTGCLGTLSRETVYDILDHYETPAIRDEDLEESSLPGRVSPRIRALAAVVRWQQRNKPSPDLGGASRRAVKSVIRHPSEHMLDRYPKKIIKEVQQSGEEPDNSLKMLMDVQDWLSWTEGILAGLNDIADNGIQDADEIPSWDALESNTNDSIKEGEALLSNIRDDGEKDRIADRLRELKEVFNDAARVADKKKISKRLEMLSEAEPSD